MGKIVAAEYVSVDGVMQDPGGVGEIEVGGWTSPYWDDDLAKLQADLLFASDALLLGRVTYEEFAASWPDPEHEQGPFAVKMNTMPKYVASRTGRRKVLIAGTGLDVCAQLPALACAAEGYDSYVVLDACGRFAPVPSVATISRLIQGGVALADTRVIVLEAMADNAHPKASEIYATLPAGLVPVDAVTEA